MHLFPNVSLIGGHGALIHWTATLAHTGAYSIVQAVGSSLGHGANSHFGQVLLTELPSGHSLASSVHTVQLLLVVHCSLLVDPHSPLIYARSSHTVQFFNVHIPTCPPSDKLTILSDHPWFTQFVEAGFANPTFPLFAVPLAYSLHFGWLGVSQYMSVHASTFPSFTLQLLHPSK